MLLAWSDPPLQRRCAGGDLQVTGLIDHQLSAEDLLRTVGSAPTLGALLTFRSVVPRVQEGAVVLALEEAEMRTRLLSPAGEPQSIPRHEALFEHRHVRALVVDDLIIAGRSLRKLAS